MADNDFKVIRHVRFYDDKITAPKFIVVISKHDTKENEFPGEFRKVEQFIDVIKKEFGCSELDVGMCEPTVGHNKYDF